MRPRKALVFPAREGILFANSMPGPCANLSPSCYLVVPRKDGLFTASECRSQVLRQYRLSHLRKTTNQNLCLVIIAIWEHICLFATDA